MHTCSVSMFLQSWAQLASASSEVLGAVLHHPTLLGSGEAPQPGGEFANVSDSRANKTIQTSLGQGSSLESSWVFWCSGITGLV